MSTSTVAENKHKEAQDFMPINGTDYLELYVSNSKQAAHYYKTAFGFKSLALSGVKWTVLFLKENKLTISFNWTLLELKSSLKI